MPRLVMDAGPIPAFARRVFLQEGGVFFSVDGEEGARPAPPNGPCAGAHAQGPGGGEAHREKQPTNRRP